MAGEAVTGRYSAARHAAVDEGGARRHPDSDDRSLVDRLLAGAGDDQGFDWGWGDPSGRGAPEREALHDIPELWDGRSGPDRGNRDEPEDERFPTPRLHGESPRDDGGATDDEREGGDHEQLAQNRPAEGRVADRDWPDRGRDDLGSDDWRVADRGSDDRGSDDRGSDDRGSDDRGSDDLRGDDRGSDDWGNDDLRGDARGSDGSGGDDRGSDDWGGPAPVFEPRRSSDRRPGLFDEPEPRDRGFEDRYEDRSLGDRRSGDQRFGFDADPLDALSTGRVRAEASPFADGFRDGEAPRRDPLDDVPMDGDHPRPREDQQDRDELDPPSPAPPRPGRDVLDGVGREPADELRVDSADGAPEAAHHVLLGRDALSPEPSEPDHPRTRGAGPADAGREPSDELRWSGDRPDVERDEPAPERRERKLADPRLRRWADRNRPSGPPRDGGDRPFAPPPSGPVPFADEQAGPGPFGSDRREVDEGGADTFGPADLFEPGGRDRPDAPRPRAADGFGDDPALAESTRTGRIHIGDAGAAPTDEPPFDRGPQEGSDPRDAAPDPTAVFGAVAPVGSARRAAPEEPALPLEEYAARRRAAEQAAASAEQAAASAAERASAAIAAAARAAEEAEAAAEIAAQAAAKANEAAEAESRAIADSAARDSVGRDEPPGRPDGPGGEAPEAPTQAVPLIAPSRAPGRRPPPRRPAGPPPRGARPDDPARAGGPQPRGGPRGGPARDGGHLGGSDGEATTVLTGLDALRDPVRPRTPEPAQAPAEMTTVTRRRPAVEPPPHADGVDDVDDADDVEHDDEPEENGLVERLRSRPVIAAVGVGAVLVLAAIVAFFTTSEPEATPAEPAPAALSAPAAPQPPAAPEIDPNSEKAVAFLTAMRDADIPTSSTGQAETEAAAAICTQIDQGANDAQIARRVPTVLPDVTRSQASDVVGFAKKLYC